ncbi:unnamed protein product [Peniophora sp. CBMAI 1063]|nr:unnamed protein product [Peniophora sp. CBMAI 1063]
MSEAVSAVSQPPLRILSLDGGGYRGLASLEILDRLMTELKRDDGSVPKPCEVFDFIIGTSTGGLIAILLGRLRLSVEQARKHYLEFGEKIFGQQAHVSDDPVHWLKTGEETLNPAPLEGVLDKVASGLDLLDLQPNACKVVALTTEKGAVASDPVFMRSYRSEHPLLPSDGSWSHNWTIKEAGRATSAAPTYFPSVHIKDHGAEKVFEDAGAAGYNNPVLKGISEVRNRIPEFQGRHIGCLVSIGTGLSKILKERSENTNPDPLSWGLFKYLLSPKDNTNAVKKRMTEFAEYLVSIASDTEDAHRVVRDDPQFKGVYFRANIPGLGQFKLDDLSKREVLQSEARNWLNGEGKSFITDCAKRMKSTTIPCFELKPAPFGKPECVGRDNVVEELSKTISSDIASKAEFKPCSILIQGPLGVGKSTVALQVMNDSRVKKTFGNRICYLRCDGMLDIAALKGKLLAMREIDGGKASDAEIQELLSSAPTLVCLDNFEQLWNISELRDEIRHNLLPLLARGSSLIVTVRGTPNIDLDVSGGWSLSTPLGPLGASDARKAILSFAHKPEPSDATERAALDSLVAKCEGLPLSLSLLGHLAGARDFTAIVTRLVTPKAAAIDDFEETRGLGATIRLTLEEDRVRKSPSALALCYALALLPDGAGPDFLRSGLIGTAMDIDEAKARLIERGIAYTEPAYGLLRMLGPLRVFFWNLTPKEQAAYGVDLPKIYDAIRTFYYGLASKPLDDVRETNTRRLYFAQARNIEVMVMRDLANPPRDASAFAAVVDAACGVSGWYVWAGVPHASPYLLQALEQARAREDLVLVGKLLLEIGRDLADEEDQEAKIRAMVNLTEAYAVGKKHADELMAKGDGMSAEEKAVFKKMYELAADASKERARLASSLGDDQNAEVWLHDAVVAYENLWDEDGYMDTFIILGGIQAKRGEVEAAVSSYNRVLDVAKGKTKYRDQEAVVCRSLSALVPGTDDKRRLLERGAALFDELDKLGAAAECRLTLKELEVVV